MPTIEQETTDKALDQLPEYGRVNDIRRLFGVKRGILYRWINEGKVKSVNIVEPGNKQGIRLIQVASVREYIRAQMRHALAE